MTRHWFSCTFISGYHPNLRLTSKCFTAACSQTDDFQRLLRTLHKLPHKMTVAKSYQNAIVALNSLQSNSQTIEKARKDRSRNAERNIAWMERLLRILAIEPDQLNNLNVIHVSGTKGKGSTCAFTESLLRHLGYRTGFYSSPHLVAVRERIRLNGRPIQEDLFTQYFWDVYDKLSKLCPPEEMPPYFKFLTVMCYYVFLQEKLDVAIMEVGIGGAYDCTNVIRQPIVCGVSSLGYDHMPILGNTLEEISWHKAGIFKPGCPAITVPQPDSAMNVLRDRATDIGAPLYIVPDLSLYPSAGAPLKLGLDGNVQSLNASLALQLVREWMKRRTLRQLSQMDSAIPKRKDESTRQNGDQDFCIAFNGLVNGESETLTPFPLTDTLRIALESCIWPGRFQRVTSNAVDFFLDGAHTKESVKYCAEWYRGVRSDAVPVTRFLVFNSTAERKPEDLMLPLTECGFDCAIFCPNILGEEISMASDLTNLTVDRDQQVNRCMMQESVWKSLTDGREMNTNTKFCASVNEAFQWIRSESTIKGGHVEVLVTGSLHLVGAVLTILDPSLSRTL